MTLPGIDMEPVFDRLTLSQWHTPDDLALRIARWAGAALRVSRILEPSAGGGALVRAAIKAGANPAAIDAIEIDPRWAKRLRDIAGLNVEERDYLSRPARDHRYDLAVLNPPYEGGMDGRFLAKAMDESDRVIALIRTVALNGDDRYQRVWKRCHPSGDFALVGLAVLAQRPDFGGEHGAATDFVVVKLARRDLYDDRQLNPYAVEWWSR